MIGKINMSEKLQCPYCNFCCRSPATYADHLKTCIKEPVKQTSTMLSRKMNKLLSKKRRYKGLMVDLSGKFGEVPPPQNESENLKTVMTQLNEMKLAKIPNIIATVRNVLMERRLNHRNNFWRRQLETN